VLAELLVLGLVWAAWIIPRYSAGSRY